MTRTVTIEQLCTFADEPLGVTGWTAVTQTMIDAFAAATGDRQWVHVDVERAREGPFGTTIAHGYLVLALVPILLKELMVVTDSTRGLNYGLDRVRFTAPVPAEAQVALEASVGHATRRRDGGVVYALDFTLHLRDATRPAALGRALYGVYPAHSAS